MEEPKGNSIEKKVKYPEFTPFFRAIDRIMEKWVVYPDLYSIMLDCTIKFERNNWIHIWAEEYMLLRMVYFLFVIWTCESSMSMWFNEKISYWNITQKNIAPEFFRKKCKQDVQVILWRYYK